MVILSISIQQAFLCNIIVFQDYWRLSLIRNCEGVAVVQVVTFSTIKAHFLLGTVGSVGIKSRGSSTMHRSDGNNTCTWLAQDSISITIASRLLYLKDTVFKTAKKPALQKTICLTLYYLFIQDIIKCILHHHTSTRLLTHFHRLVHVTLYDWHT